MDFDYLDQVIKQESMLNDPLTQEEEECILALHEQASNDLFNEWLARVY